MDHKRIQELAGIRENGYSDADDDARYERETQVRQHVKKTFEAMGFDLRHVYYDEELQTVDVDIETQKHIPLEKIAQILQLDFGTNFAIYPYNGYFEVRFSWNVQG